MSEGRHCAKVWRRRTSLVAMITKDAHIKTMIVLLKKKKIKSFMKKKIFVGQTKLSSLYTISTLASHVWEL